MEGFRFRVSLHAFSGPLPKACVRIALTAQSIWGHRNFCHAWEKGDGCRIKTTTMWPVGALNSQARNIWPSFKMERATGRFKGSWIHNRKETSKWSTCIYLLTLHLCGAEKAHNVHVPSQAQIFVLELNSYRMVSVFTQSYSLYRPLISVLFLLPSNLFLL